MTRLVFPRLGLLIGMGILLSACALIKEDSDTDTVLNRNDRPEAERTARTTFAKNTGCQKASLKILSVKDSEGAPLGPVWGNYSIALKGCGQTKTYVIECKGTYTKPDCMTQE